jgi:hypothetical protein
VLPQSALDDLSAISDLSLYESFNALAFQLFNPPSLPSATAAGFLSGSVAGAAVPWIAGRFGKPFRLNLCLSV